MAIWAAFGQEEERGKFRLFGSCQDAHILAKVRVVCLLYCTNYLKTFGLGSQCDDPPAHSPACSYHDQFRSHLFLLDLQSNLIAARI